MKKKSRLSAIVEGLRRGVNAVINVLKPWKGSLEEYPRRTVGVALMFMVFFTALAFSYTYALQRETDAKIRSMEAHFRNQSAMWHSEQKKWESEYAFVKKLAESNAEEIEMTLTTHLAEMSRISDELSALSRKLEMAPDSTLEMRLMAHRFQDLEQSLDRLRSGLYVRRIWGRSTYHHDPRMRLGIYPHDLRLQSAKVTILALGAAMILSFLIWRFYIVGGSRKGSGNHS